MTASGSRSLRTGPCSGLIRWLGKAHSQQAERHATFNSINYWKTNALPLRRKPYVSAYCVV
jgi:hypothetical protein